MLPVAGVDGCRSGWVVVSAGGAFVCADFAGVLASLPDDAVIGIDIPIGLLDQHVPGGRECDRAARRLLGVRRSSVFTPPIRPALGARSLAEARTLGWPTTMQALNITPKVADVDRSLTPAVQERVFEVHPELAFAALDGGAVVPSLKATRAGRDDRRLLLERAGVVVPPVPGGAQENDLLDACAVAWSAYRIARDTHRRVPEQIQRDRRGLRMDVNW
jgi:predicted RNase H-like nuclease